MKKIIICTLLGFGFMVSCQNGKVNTIVEDVDTTTVVEVVDSVEVDSIN